MPRAASIFSNVQYDIQTEESPATSSCTDPKPSHVIDQFQLCLERTGPLSRVLWSLPLWPDCTSTGRRFPLSGKIKWKKMLEPCGLCMGAAESYITAANGLFVCSDQVSCSQGAAPTPRSQGLSWRSQAHTCSMLVPLVEQGRSNHAEGCTIWLHTNSVERRTKDDSEHGRGNHSRDSDKGGGDLKIYQYCIFIYI